MSELNEANASKIETELVRPHLGLVRDSAARATVETRASDLLRQLRERDVDDLDFGYKVRNEIVGLLLRQGVESGMGNLFDKIVNGQGHIDLNLDEKRVPRLRPYDV